jgi:hypothetical protein
MSRTDRHFCAAPRPRTQSGSAVVALAVLVALAADLSPGAWMPPARPAGGAERGMALDLPATFARAVRALVGRCQGVTGCPPGPVVVAGAPERDCPVVESAWAAPAAALVREGLIDLPPPAAA